MIPAKPTQPTLYIVVNNHFDLTWRRCWQRPFTFQDKTFISYADIETYYLEDNIALAQKYPDYKFEAESVIVVRKFIERRPDMLPVLQALAREGRFAITGGGEAIVDANMVTGESLVRNYVDGLMWVEQVFGQTTRLAVRNDAFGNSAQLPQILRGVEIAWATGMSYSPAQGLYWRGLDGSTILHKTIPIVAQGGGVVKYPPCTNCDGSGKVGDTVCPACSGRGIDPNLRAELPEDIYEEGLHDFNAGLVRIAPEELLPNPRLPEWAAYMRQNYTVKFALEEEVLPLLEHWLDAVDHPDPSTLHPGIELNPNNSGCLVTRILTKQAVRRQEYALAAAETLSVMASLHGAAYPKAQLQHIRHNQYFTMFHDAITATHVDAAYQELLDIYHTIDQDIAAFQNAALQTLSQPSGSGGLSVLNLSAQPVTAVCSTVLNPSPAGFIDASGGMVPVLETCWMPEGGQEVSFLVKDVPPFSAVLLQPVPGDTPTTAPSSMEPAHPLSGGTIENSRFRVQANAHGLVSIFDKTLEREILTSGEYMPGELVLEHDEGSPWATLHPDQSRAPQHDYTNLMEIGQFGGLQRMLFRIVAPRELGFSGSALDASLTVTLVEGLNRVDFKLHAGWSAFNYRLRVAMPVPVSGPVLHQYEIPYGAVTRQPYTPSFRWAGANGDWPAINWAGVEQPGMSVALLNKGTPSYRIENNGATETIFLSLLRSPAIPTYLHEPYFYSMTDYDGMRDEGEHDFDYAITAYPGAFEDSPVVQDADAYNAGLLTLQGLVQLPPMPELESGMVRLAAIKWAEAGDGIVLRLVEYRGKGGDALIRLPLPVRSAMQTNLLERQAQPLDIQDGALRLTLRPWEIATVKFVL